MDKGKEVINEPFWMHSEGVPELIYINKEALPQKKERGFFLDDNFNAGWNACLTEIFKIPAADIRPVIHSRWILNKDGSGTCKNCGHVQYYCWDLDNWDNFCHFCGADMREANT